MDPRNGPEAGEDIVRRALAGRAEQVRPSPVPVAQLVRRGRARLVRRRRAGAACAVGALVLAGAGAGVPLASGRGDGDGGGGRARAEAAQPAAPGTRPPAAPRVLEPGRRVVAAPGYELWLTAEGKCVTRPDLPEGGCRSAVDGNRGGGVGFETDYRLASGFYVGPGTPARVVLEGGGRVLEARLVTLAGHPGWAVWYADLGDDGRPQDVPDRYSVTVQDARGRVLDRFDPDTAAD